MNELIPDQAGSTPQPTIPPDSSQDTSQPNTLVTEGTTMARQNDLSSISPSVPPPSTNPAPAPEVNPPMAMPTMPEANQDFVVNQIKSPDSVYPELPSDPMAIIASETTSIPEVSNLTDNQAKSVLEPQPLNSVPVVAPQTQEQTFANNAVFGQPDADNFAEPSKKSKWPWIIGIVAIIVFAIIILSSLGISISF